MSKLLSALVPLSRSFSVLGWSFPGHTSFSLLRLLLALKTRRPIWILAVDFRVQPGTERWLHSPILNEWVCTLMLSPTYRSAKWFQYNWQLATEYRPLAGWRSSVPYHCIVLHYSIQQVLSLCLGLLCQSIMIAKVETLAHRLQMTLSRSETMAKGLASFRHWSKLEFLEMQQKRKWKKADESGEMWQERS